MTIEGLYKTITNQQNAKQHIKDNNKKPIQTNNKPTQNIRK